MASTSPTYFLPSESDDADETLDLTTLLETRCGHAFSSLGITKSFRHKFVIVVDEIGPFPGFHRALCASWKRLRKFLCAMLRLESEDQLFLLTAGTGSESVNQDIRAPLPANDYAIWTPDTPKFFADSLEALSKDSLNNCVKKFAEATLNLMFDNDTTKSRSEDQTKSRYTLKLESVDKGMCHLARIAAHNCRCGALALEKIVQLAKSRSSTIDDDQVQGLCRVFRVKCPEWCVEVGDAYRSFGRMKYDREDEVYNTFADALRVVVRRQKTLDDWQVDALCCSTGLLEDRARIITPLIRSIQACTMSSTKIWARTTTLASSSPRALLDTTSPRPSS